MKLSLIVVYSFVFDNRQRSDLHPLKLSSAEVTQRIELDLLEFLSVFMVCSMVNFSFTFFFFHIL
jgi:hypothetical protein